MYKERKYTFRDFHDRLTSQGLDWVVYSVPVDAIRTIGLGANYDRFVKAQTQGLMAGDELQDARAICALIVAQDCRQEDKFWQEVGKMLSLKDESRAKFIYHWLHTKKVLEERVLGKD